MSKFDVRRHPRYQKAMERLPKAKLRPLVGPRELDELELVLRVVPDLEFPINSGGELLDQIGEGRTLPVLEMDVDPVRMIKYMPAYYFPIASYENLVEKMAELVRQNRRAFDEEKVSKKIKEKVGRTRFPINTPDELERALGRTPEFNVAGRKMKTRDTIGTLPRDFFPVKDVSDLQRKAVAYLQRRPLIEKD